MRMSEIVAMMYKTGITTFAADKVYRPWSMGGGVADSFNTKTPHFLSKFDLTELMEHPISGHTRMFGALVSAGGLYVVYNYGRSSYSWNNQGESQLADTIYYVMQHWYPKTMQELDWKPYRMQNAIVFGTDMDVALKYCTNPFLKYNFKKDNDNYYELPTIFNRVYQHMHYIPLTKEGMFALRVLVMDGWRDKLCEIHAYTRKSEGIGRHYTVMEKENQNTFYYYFLDCDLHSLYDFIIESNTSINKYVVVCYDWQADMVRQLADTCRIKGIEVEAHSTSVYKSYFASEMKAEEEYWKEHLYFERV